MANVVVVVPSSSSGGADHRNVPPPPEHGGGLESGAELAPLPGGRAAAPPPPPSAVVVVTPHPSAAGGGSGGGGGFHPIGGVDKAGAPASPVSGASHASAAPVLPGGGRAGDAADDHPYDVHITRKAVRVCRTRWAVGVATLASVLLVAWTVDVIVRFAATVDDCQALLDSPDQTGGGRCAASPHCHLLPASCVACEADGDDVQRPGVCGDACYRLAVCQPLGEYVAVLALLCGWLGCALLAATMWGLRACIEGCCRDGCVAAPGAAAAADDDDHETMRVAVPGWLACMGAALALASAAVAVTPRARHWQPAWVAGGCVALAAGLLATTATLLVWKRFWGVDACCGAADNHGRDPGVCYGVCCTVDPKRPAPPACADA